MSTALSVLFHSLLRVVALFVICEVLNMQPLTPAYAGPASAAHMPAGPRIVVILVDRATLSDSVDAQANARLAARLLSLVSPGSAGAIVIWQAITDRTYAAPAAGEVIVPPMPSAPIMAPCSSGWDWACNHANKQRADQFQQLLQRARGSVAAQTRRVLAASFPRASGTPDIAGGVERAAQVFRKQRVNSLIIMSGLESPPPGGAHWTLRGVDVDVVRFCQRSFSACDVAKQAWAAAFERSGALDMATIAPEQLPVWFPLAVS